MKILRYMTYAVLSMLIPYLMVAFIRMDASVYSWGSHVRGGYVVMVIGMFFLTVSILSTIREEEASNKRWKDLQERFRKVDKRWREKL